MASAVAELHPLEEILTGLKNLGDSANETEEPGTVDARPQAASSVAELEEMAHRLIRLAATLPIRHEKMRDAILLGATTSERDDRLRDELAELWATVPPWFLDWSARAILKSIRKAGLASPPWKADLLHAVRVLSTIINEIVGWPESAFSVRVSWRAYLRTMWNLFCSALFHPRSTTTIDLVTGDVISRE
jgi:hypothetical protein